MPVPVFGADRPTGQVEPPVDLAGVTELRVHGVGGTTPGQLLDDLAPQQVAGDSVAGFYRTLDAGGRHVEAYSWGGLTSRSGFRVLWLLLLPFMLANLAGWMCSPRARASAAYRWLVRLAALGITLSGLVVVMLGSVDVLAYQCGTDPGCRGGHWWLAPLRWGPVAGHPARQVLLGALVPAALLVLLGVLSYRSRERYETVRPPVVGMPAAPTARSAASVPGGLADPDFWDGARSTKRLGRAHTAAATGLLTLAVLHGLGTAPLLQVLALACLAGAVALLAVDDGPDLPGAVLQAAAVAVGLAAAVWLWTRPALAAADGPLPGLRTVVAGTYVGLLAVMALVLLATIGSGRTPGSFRALAPFVVLALAIALLNLALLGLLVAVARLAGPVAWTGGTGPAGSLSVYPVVQAALPYLTLVPVGALVLFLLAEVGLWWWAGRGPLPTLADEYASCDPAPLTGPLGVWQVSGLDDRRWRTTLARARRLAKAGTDVQYLLSFLALFGSGLMIYAVWQLTHGQSPAPGSRLTGLGTTIAVALPVALLGALRSGWRSLAGRRRIGVLWDVGTFWPRAFHPLAPPSYAERAVPDLQRRMWWLHDNGGTVLVAAHSQGTVLAAAALLQQTARAPGSRVGLVTFGSPLGKLYAWGFPAWVNDSVLAGLAGPDTTWVNVHYATDYIGGPVFRDAAAGVDRRIPDPRTSRAVYGQPLPAVGSHSGYWRDPAMWSMVDALAADLRR
jgi:hypothetical protein